MELTLNDYRVSALNIINEKTPSENQDIKMSYQYGIRMDNESHCSVKTISTLRLADEDEQEDKTFYIQMDIEGFFSFKEMDKNLLLKKSAEALLPLLRSHIATAMASVGLDPIVIPLSRIKAFNNME